MPLAVAGEAKAFQFIEGRPDSRREDFEEDKENYSALSTVAKTADSKPAFKHETSSPSKPFPSTPATRLPLADLIGDTEQHQNFQPTTNISPEERIQWHTANSPRSSTSKTTPAARNRKRARSSSPPSTSQRSTTKRLRAERSALNLGELKKSLRTPQTDPSTDLWNRYTTSTAGNGAEYQTTSISNLLSSSPHALGQPIANVSGLRRWISCGVEFPSSKTKRRKTQHVASKLQLAEDNADMSELKEEDEEDESPKILRTGNLLERLQKSLQQEFKPDAEPKGPSSSSPLPNRHEDFDRQSISPCRASELAARKQDKDPTPPGGALKGSPTLAPENQIISAGSSSFGSDTLESDMLEVAVPVMPVQEAVGGADTDMKAQPPLSPQPLTRHPPEQPVVHQPIVKEEEDEFGDDLDLSAEDFEVVASTSEPIQTSVGPAISNGDTRRFTTAAKPAVEIADGDEISDDDIDEELFAAAEFSATQSASSLRPGKNSSRHRKRAIQRYLVKDVHPQEYTSSQGRLCPEKVIYVEDEANQSKSAKSITLRESWLDTRCTKGSYVHIIGEFDKHGRCLINDAQNMLILHPDHLISALVVADSFGCMRKAVLQDRVKATNAPSPPMLYGTVLHEIFQEAMQANRWDSDWLSTLIEIIVARHVEDLYQTGLSVEQATEHLQGKMPELQAWAEVFIKAKPDGNPMVKDMHGKRVKMSVNKLLDVEEHIWSPMYGLKGNIDATVQVNMEDDAGQRTLTVPLEVKTGKMESASHRAQTALYTLLLSDRYDVAVAYGILYYVERSETSRIPAIRHEIRHMIMQRNELACYVRERLSLPPMIRNTHTCNRCYAKVPCFLYHKLIEEGDGETSGLGDKFDAVTRHLKPAHQDFFKKWDELLTKEESEMMKFRRELWTMLSTEREKLGRCFANVSLIPESLSEEPGTSKINRFSYRFRKHKESSAFSFSESQIAVGEPIVISDEKGHYALAKGFITTVTKARISVAVDRRLHNTRKKLLGFNAEDNQTFAGIMDVSIPPPTAPSSSSSWSADASLLYRLDKDEYSNGMATIRNNLIELMTANVSHSRDLRSLIVDLAAPRFKTSSSAYTISGPASQSSINADQQAAIEKILTAQDYALVLGMPGTGKTTTIAHIIRTLVAKGKTVLLTSYTHTAVDNILLKIRQDKIPVLRLGSLARIHPEVKEFATLAAEPRNTVEELRAAYHDPPVVATTCLGINHTLFSQRTFDYCIVDEASQITLPVCLGPIRMARSFVLVGDHYQLPPLVQNREALKGGLDVSLFKLLSETHPDAVATLSCQYRMNEALMRLSNELIYDGRLRCGSPSIAQRKLELPFADALANAPQTPTVSRSSATSSNALSADLRPSKCTSLSSTSCLLSVTVSPSAPAVTFLNTDALVPASHETRQGPRITNTLEASLTTILVRGLLSAGVASEAIGIITLYRSQLALIKSHLASVPNAGAVEAHTADRFQGRDKDVIIVSFVRSNEANEVGELLRDWRRVNVSITRAKRKLLFLGSKGTLERGDELLGRLVKLCGEVEGGVVDVGGDWGHDFPTPINPTPVPATALPPSTQNTGVRQQKQAQRQPLAPLPASSNNIPKPSKNYKNPAYKAPTRVVQGMKPLTKMRKDMPMLNDVIRELVDDAVDLAV